MDFNIVDKKDNPSLKRQEISFSAGFDASIPSRAQAKQALSSALSIPIERIVLVKLEGSYGSHSASGFAHVYENAEDAKKGKKHLLIRDGMAAKEAKKEKKKKEAKKAA